MDPDQPIETIAGYQPVYITRKAIRAWRQTQGVPRARIGFYFGTATILFFPDGLDPASFDYFPLPNIGNGYVMIERATIARRDYRELYRGTSGIF